MGLLGKGTQVCVDVGAIRCGAGGSWALQLPHIPLLSKTLLQI